MSRWFRHYAGMARDDKLVRASIKSKQAVERVVWVWTAILESAAEIDDGGRYEIDHAEMARFLRCPESKLVLIENALRDLGRVSEGNVAKWSNRQFQSDRSAERTKRYRDRHKGQDDTHFGKSRDEDVTSQERRGDAPETETETETTDKSVVPTQRANRLPADFEIPSEWIAWATSEASLSRSQAAIEGAKFIDYWHGKSGRDATKLDWQATWRNWCRNARPARESGYAPGHSGVPL